MDPTKDLAAYGYGSIAWKERVESWKIRQGKLQMMMTEGGQLQASGKGGHDDGGPNGPDLPMSVLWLKFLGFVCCECGIFPCIDFLMFDNISCASQLDMTINTC